MSFYQRETTKQHCMCTLKEVEMFLHHSPFFIMSTGFVHHVWLFITYLYSGLCLTSFIHVVCFLEFFHCCVSLCCVFLQYSFTLSVWSRVFIGVFFHWCVSCVGKHTTLSVWSPRVVFIIVFSLLCLLLLY